jgi:hypothetical protein
VAASTVAPSFVKRKRASKHLVAVGASPTIPVGAALTSPTAHAGDVPSDAKKVHARSNVKKPREGAKRKPTVHRHAIPRAAPPTVEIVNSQEDDDGTSHVFGGMLQMYDGENPRDVPSSFMEILNDSSMNTTEIYDNGSEEDEDVEEVEDSDAYDQDVLEEVDATAFDDDVKGKKKERAVNYSSGRA